MESKTYKGEWWSPDASDKRVPGIVEYTRDAGEAEFLGLLGGPSERVDFMEVSHDDYYDGFLLGETTDAEYVTIADAVLTEPSIPDMMSEKGIPSSQYRFTRIYEGGHFDEEPEFNQLSFTFEGLVEWFGQSRIDYEILNENEDVRTRYNVKDTKEITVQLDSAELTFVFGIGGVQSTTKTVLEDSVSANIQLEDPTTFPALRRQYIQPLQRYFALATSEPVQMQDVTGIQPEGNRVKIRSTIPDHTPQAGDVNQASVFFNPDDVELEASIQHWFEHEKEAKYLFNFYFGTIYNPRLYLEHQFLSLAVAIESYFGHKYPNYSVMDKSEYKELRKGIIAEIPDSAAVKDRIENLLISIGNLPSFSDKLRMVVDDYKQVLGLMMEVDETISSATTIRHDLAHGLGSDYTTSELVETRYRLQIFIECVLLDIAGMDDEAKAKTLLSKYQGADFIEFSGNPEEE